MRKLSTSPRYMIDITGNIDITRSALFGIVGGGYSDNIEKIRYLT